MTSPTYNLTDLAARCESAAGADRELDAEIGVAIGRYFLAEPRYPGAKRCFGYIDGDGSRVEPGNGAPDSLIPAYSASLDAALSLVPEGFDWILGRTNDGLTIHAEVGGRGEQFLRFADTPALALCAASLRARAALDADGGEG